MLLDSSTIESILWNWYKEIKIGNIPVIDLSRYDYIDLGAYNLILAFVYSTIEQRWQDRIVKINQFPIVTPRNLSVFKFLINSGFIRFACVNEEAFINANEIQRQNRPIKSEKVLPFTRILFGITKEKTKSSFQNENDRLINTFISLFHEELSKESQYDNIEIGDIRGCINEINENIFIHSESWGFSSACLTKSGLIICMCDIGVGIQHTLLKFKNIIVKKLNRDWGDRTAIIAATHPHVSSSYHDGGGGMGLHQVKNFIKEHKGEFEIRSFSGKAVYDYKDIPDSQTWEGRVLVPIPGVQIRIWIPLMR